jgi:hypothetical protein
VKNLHWLTVVGLCLPVLVAAVNLAHIQSTPPEVRAARRPDYIRGRVLLAKLQVAATALSVTGLIFSAATRKESARPGVVQPARGSGRESL